MTIIKFKRAMKKLLGKDYKHSCELDNYNIKVLIRSPYRFYESTDIRSLVSYDIKSDSIKISLNNDFWTNDTISSAFIMSIYDENKIIEDLVK